MNGIEHLILFFVSAVVGGVVLFGLWVGFEKLLSATSGGGKNKKKMCYLGLLGLIVGSLALAGLIQNNLLHL